MKEIDSVLIELLKMARDKQLPIHDRLEAYRLYLTVVAPLDI